MSDIQKLLNQFSETVGEQIKSVSDSLNKRLDDYEEAISSLQATIVETPEPAKGLDLQTGIDAIRDELKAMVDAAVDGISVADGEPGKDALQIEMLPEIDESKSYPRGTYAIHNGGVFRAYQKTAGMKGWECILNGVADLSASVEGKVMTISVALSDGTEKSLQHAIPQPEYKGIFKRGESYAMGDSVTYDGSMWVLMTEKSEKDPGKGTDWRLAVKRGRDGRGLYAIARDSGYKGTEKELLAYVMKGEIPDNVVRIGGDDA